MFVCFILLQQMAPNSLDRPHCPPTHKVEPSSASQLLGLKYAPLNPSSTAALGRMGPVPHLGTTVELTL